MPNPRYAGISFRKKLEFRASSTLFELCLEQKIWLPNHVTVEILVKMENGGTVLMIIVVLMTMLPNNSTILIIVHAHRFLFFCMVACLNCYFCRLSCYYQM